jgi:phosphate transport system substrate-binding protein
MRMKSTKKIVILMTLVLSIAILAFTGCVQDNNSQEDTSQEPNNNSSTNTDNEESANNEDSFAGTYNFGGSTTVEPIALAAIEEFEELYPDVKISYDGTGSSTGIQGVLDGTYSLGAASRDIKEEEKQSGAVAIPIALDGIAVIANENVDVADLSLEQLAKIFTGEITNWKEVGGSDNPIVVVNRDEASGTRGAFSEMVLEEALGKDPEPTFIAEAVTTDSNGDMITKVGTTPNAIGYCGFGYIEQAKDAGAKTISIEGVQPEIDTVADGSYPISRYLNFVSNGELQEGTLEKEFIDFLLSDEGQAIVEDEGFIRLPDSEE